MTIHLPEDLTGLIRAEVMNGHFASEDEMVAAAVREYLQRMQAAAAQTVAAGAASDLTRTGQEPDDQELQRRLYEAGLLGEIKPPMRDLTPYRHRQAVPIHGEPLSETLLRERR